MARLVNADTGVIVDVDDETAESLRGFEPEQQKAPAKRTAKASESDQK